MTPGIFSRVRIRVTTLLAMLLPLCAALAEPTVSGTLSTNTASVGEVVQFEVRVDDGSPRRAPNVPVIDGLEIHEAGGSSGVAGSTTRGLSFYASYLYAVVPKRDGKFTIPAIEINVGGKVLKTLPATLMVAPGEVIKEAGEFAFAKILLPKKSLCVGEVAPLEIRLYLDASARWDPNLSPAINGDGFTTRPGWKGARRELQIEGKTYILISLNTVITPGKAGKITIGPLPLKLVVSKVARGRPRFGLGMGFEPAEEITVTAPALEIEVKPLPVIGRPKDFSGAIGKFEFSATGTPERVKVGEPVSMKLTIKGSGNFDRIGQPALDEPEGWTTYSAKDSFSGNDGAGIEGVKTFDLPVTPTVAKTTMPVFAFSYFDPETEKYVTLKSAPAPLMVEGLPVVAVPTPAPVQNSAPPKLEPKTPAAQDILANLPDIGKASAAFGPSLSPAVFFSILGAPVPLAFAFVAWRRRRGDAKVARAAALRRERAGMIAQVKNSANRAEVFDAAVKAVRLAVQLENGALPEDDADALLGSRKLDAETEKSLREIFDARTDLLYAGAARGDDRISDIERDRVMDAITTFEKSARQ